MKKSEKKVRQSISRNGFIGFIVMMLFFFVMEFVFTGNDIPLEEDILVGIPPWVKFVLYVVGMGAVVIFSVDKPEMSKFITTVRDALEDGRITADEAVAMMRQGFFVFQGFWADVSQRANKDKKAIVEMDSELPKE